MGETSKELKSMKKKFEKQKKRIKKSDTDFENTYWLVLLVDFVGDPVMPADKVGLDLDQENVDRGTIDREYFLTPSLHWRFLAGHPTPTPAFVGQYLR